mmetsp:Transcript_37822/g.66661  ORF Transcript_37822/g.66661 Transcript_37822/m.66661 type:complete len:108 (+) Transcript_37822:445-768(+)
MFHLTSPIKLVLVMQPLCSTHRKLPLMCELFFDEFNNWEIPSSCIAEATWNEPRRTREQYIERYRNSPIMHDSVPDEHRPALFEDGKRVPFPEPTKVIRRPRIRHTK